MNRYSRAINLNFLEITAKTLLKHNKQAEEE
jgi:hypothetical protein